jgi:acetyl esterase/lipase
MEMSRKLLAMAMAILASVSSPAFAADPDDATSKYLPTPPVFYPAGVTSDRDVTYAELSGFRPLTLDLYLPKPDGAPKPLLVFVHGGAWLHLTARDGGTFRDFPAVLASIAARGYVVASVNYRNSGEAHFPGSVQDVEMAIQWLRGHAAQYGIDPARVVAWGSSAGGNIATLIGTGCDAPNLAPPAVSRVHGSQPSACVQGVIDWYGVIDLQRNSDDLGSPATPKATHYVNAYLGCEMAKCPDGWVRSTNPITYIDPKDPPFLIQHGTADKTVSLKQAERLYDALKAAGVKAELVTYAGVSHGFAAPGGGPDDAVNAQALDKVFEFLGRLFPASVK